MTPEEIKLAEISEAKQAEEETKKTEETEEIVPEILSAEVKTEESIKKVKPDLNTIKWTAIFKFIH